MPSTIDLNAFKNAVNQLGNEPEVVKARDEVLEDIQPGEEGFPLMAELAASHKITEGAAEEPQNQPNEEAFSAVASTFAEDDSAVGIPVSEPVAASSDSLADTPPSSEDLQQGDDAGYNLLPEFSQLLNLSTEDSAPLDLSTPAADTAGDEAEAVSPQIHQLLETGFDELDNDRSHWESQQEEALAELAMVQENVSLPASGDEGPSAGKPESVGSSALGHIALLEQALQQHRSADLYNITEKYQDEEYEDYQELEFHLSQENARDFLLQLSSYPLALKLAIEEEIGENNLKEEAVETLVEMISSGIHPRKVANYFFSQTGKRIVLPKGQRYHAIDRDFANKRFYRQFSQIGFPLLYRAIVGVFFLAIFFWLPFYYLYRPLRAYLFYQQGYRAIFLDQFNRAEKNFTLATNGWPIIDDIFFVKGWAFRSWFLKYAEAYTQRKDYQEAMFKMRQTLLFYPDDKNAWLRYIGLLSLDMGEFAKAEEVVQQYYDRFGRDYQLLISRGINYLHWGEVNSVYYEEAKKVFELAYNLGQQDALSLLYLLDYYIRTAPFNGERQRQQELASFFIKADPSQLNVPGQLLSEVLSRTADYYMQQGNMNASKKLLLNAESANSNNMDVYRSFARYYRLIGDKEREMKALNMSLFFLSYRDDRYTTSNLIEKLFLTEQLIRAMADRSLEASFILPNLLEQLQGAERRHLGPDQQQVADIFALLGNFYYQNTPEALNSIYYYAEATRLGMDSAYLHYRYGYMLYQKEDYLRAADQFLQSQIGLKPNDKVKYALGNSLLRIGSYESAQGILEDAYTSLQDDLRTSFLLDPQNSLEARDRLFMLVRLANDLGVSYYRKARQSPSSDKEQIALAYFIQGMGYLDILGREDTLQLKLPPELLFRPRLLTQKTVERLEQAIPAQGLVTGSLPERNLQQVLHSGFAAPLSDVAVRSYQLDLLEPTVLEETMNYQGEQEY